MRNGIYLNGIETKAKLIEISRDLFIARGVKNVSVSEICREAGIANGNFSYYFPKKPDIIRAVIGKMLSDTDTLCNSLITGAEPELYKCCLETYLFPLFLSKDRRRADFVLDVYDELSTRNIISEFLNQKHTEMLHIAGKAPEHDLIYMFAAADTHSKMGLLRDMMERCNYAPEQSEILNFDRLVFLVACRLCYIDDEEAYAAIQYAEEIISSANL